MQWADLRADGVELVIEEQRDGAHQLALHAVSGAVPAIARKLGFEPVSGGRYVRREMEISLEALRRVFPHARACDREPAEVVRAVDPLRTLRLRMRAAYGAEVDVDRYIEAQPDAATRIRARAMHRLLGVEPMFLRYTGVDPRLNFAGVALRGQGDRRTYVNVDAEFPLMGVLGHEAVHVMRRDQPRLYEDLVAGLRPLIDQQAFARYARRLDAGHRGIEGSGLSADQIREEAVADIVGDMLLDPAVWSSIDDGDLITRVLEWLQSFLQRMADALRRRQPAVEGCIGGRDLLLDVQAAAEQVGMALAAWRDANRGEAPVGLQLAPAFRRIETENGSPAPAAFAQSVVRNADGMLKPVFRGEWGPLAEHPFDATTLPTPPFSASPDVASVYAMDPWATARERGPSRVGAYYLDLRQPLQLGSLDEDVVDFGVLRDALTASGAVTERELREAFADLEGVRHFPPAELAKPPRDRDVAHFSPSADAVGDEDYVDTYRVADSPRFVELARRAGYDGMMFMGTFTSPDLFHRSIDDAIEAGYDDTCSMAMEYRVFDRDQVREVFHASFEPAFAGAAFKRAWHGSPHRYSSPSLDHVGRGEGHGAYGWGLYLADECRVGAFYRDLMLRRAQPYRVGGQCVDYDGIVAAAERELGPGSGDLCARLADRLRAGESARDIARQAPHRHDGAEVLRVLDALEIIPLQAVRQGTVIAAHRRGVAALTGETAWGVARATRSIERVLPDHAGVSAARDAALECERGRVQELEQQHGRAVAAGDLRWRRDLDFELREARAAVKLLGDADALFFDARPFRQEGHLYAAELEDGAVLLDWDLPLAEQPAAADAFPLDEARALVRAWERKTGDRWEGNFWQQTGHELYASLEDLHGDARGASEALMRRGFAGLQYLDGDSRYARNSGDATRNYVIWELDVVRRFTHEEELDPPALAATP